MTGQQEQQQQPQEQQTQQLSAASQSVFTASRLGYFVHALCASNTNTKYSDSIFRCIEHAPISIQDYTARLGTYMKCSPSAFVLAAILVHRLWEKKPDYFCDLSALKIAATASVIAIKFLDDGFFNNAYYAQCAGVTLEEMNLMELCFLICIDFRVFVKPDQFKVAEARLANIESLLCVAPPVQETHAGTSTRFHPKQQQQQQHQQQHRQQPSQAVYANPECHREQ